MGWFPREVWTGLEYFPRKKIQSYGYGIFEKFGYLFGKYVG